MYRQANNNLFRSDYFSEYFSPLFLHWLEMGVQKMKLTCDENCLKRSGHHAAIEKLLIVLGGIQLQLRLGQLLGHVPTFSWPVLLREVFYKHCQRHDGLES